jgi:hypothetical protein
VSQATVDQSLIRARSLSERADIETRAAGIMGKAATDSGSANALDAKASADQFAGYFGAGTALLSAATKWPALSANKAAGGGGSAATIMPFNFNPDSPFGIY